MPIDRLQLKICAFSGKLNVCSKRVLLSWIKICSDFTLQTQIFTQKYRSWLRFYSEYLRKKLAVGGSGHQSDNSVWHRPPSVSFLFRTSGKSVKLARLVLTFHDNTLSSKKNLGNQLHSWDFLSLELMGALSCPNLRLWAQNRPLRGPFIRVIRIGSTACLIDQMIYQEYRYRILVVCLV